MCILLSWIDSYSEKNILVWRPSSANDLYKLLNSFLYEKEKEGIQERRSTMNTIKIFVHIHNDLRYDNFICNIMYIHKKWTRMIYKYENCTSKNTVGHSKLKLWTFFRGQGEWPLIFLCSDYQTSCVLNL